MTLVDAGRLLQLFLKKQKQETYSLLSFMSTLASFEIISLLGLIAVLKDSMERRLMWIAQYHVVEVRFLGESIRCAWRGCASKGSTVEQVFRAITTVHVV